MTGVGFGWAALAVICMVYSIVALVQGDTETQKAFLTYGLISIVLIKLEQK